MRKFFIIVIMVCSMVLVMASCVNVYKKGVEYKGYPEKDIPIYDDAVVFSYEEDGDEITLEYGTQDDAEDIAQFYAELFESDDFSIIDFDDSEDDEFECEGVFDDEIFFSIEAEESRGKPQDYFDYVVTVEIEEADEKDLEKAHSLQNSNEPVGFWLTVESAGMDVSEYGSGFELKENGDLISYNEFMVDGNVGRWEAAGDNVINLTDPETQAVYEFIVEGNKAVLYADGMEMTLEKVDSSVFSAAGTGGDFAIDNAAIEGYYYFVEANGNDVRESGSGFELLTDGKVINYNDFQEDGEFKWSLKSDGTIEIYDDYNNEDFVLILNGDGTAEMTIDEVFMTLEKVDGTIFGAQAQAPEDSDIGSDGYVPNDIEGTDVELDYLTITVLDGWKTMDVNDGIQIYKGSEVLQINLEGYGQSEEYVETYIKNAIEAYDGTDMTKENIWGLDFLGTTYKVGGYYQVVNARIYGNDGQLLVVKMANLSSTDVPKDMQAMLNSVKIK